MAQFAFGDQTIDGLRRAREWLRQRSHWRGPGACDFLVERLKPRAGVETSPENVAGDDALARLAAAYPRARYLHLTQHPVTMQRSLEENLRRRVPEFSAPGQPMSGMAYWVVETKSPDPLVGSAAVGGEEAAFQRAMAIDDDNAAWLGTVIRKARAAPWPVRMGRTRLGCWRTIATGILGFSGGTARRRP